MTGRAGGRTTAGRSARQGRGAVPRRAGPERLGRAPFAVSAILLLLSASARATDVPDATSGAGEPALADVCPGPAAEGEAALADATTRFVAVDGSDEDEGSFEKPWRSVRHGVAGLGAGVTLLIREGVYREGDITIEASGAADRPVSIRGYPCERVVVDATELAASANDPGAWELVDARTRTYRSVASGFAAKVYGAKMRSGDRTQSLVTYVDDPEAGGRGLADLLSGVHGVDVGARYVGPGIAVHEGRLYLRLAWYPVDGVSDPYGADGLHARDEDVRIELSGASQVFRIEGSHVELADMTVRGAARGIKIARSAVDTRAKRLVLDVHGVAVTADDGVTGVRLERLRVKGDFPRWLAWTDMKGGDGQSRPAHHWINRAAAVSASDVTDLSVTDSVFENVFDGVVVDGSQIEIGHDIASVVDDMVQLGTDSYRVEIHHNRIHGAGIGYNGKGDSAEPGTVFVHHNVIDARAPVLWSRDDVHDLVRDSYKGWQTASPFPHHTFSGVKAGVPWKIYHNTVLFDSEHRSHGADYQLWEQRNDTGVAHEVYNNIFVDVADGRFTSGLDIAVTGQAYDGNVYWSERSGTPQATYADLVGVDGKVDYATPEAFIRSREFEATRASYAPGWEAGSASVDPRLDESFRPHAEIGRMDIGVTLPSDWPGPRHGVVGAVPPSGRP